LGGPEVHQVLGGRAPTRPAGGVLVSAAVEAHVADRAAQVARACAAGGVVAAQVEMAG
jgi:hypothetical protein